MIFSNNLDDKGRLMLPAKLRSEIKGNTLVITQSIDRCFWVFTADRWAEVVKRITEASSMLQSKKRIMMRRILAPAQEVEIDKTGRINIAPTLREYAGLSKECLIYEMNTVIEIWDKKVLEKFEEEEQAVIKEASEDLGQFVLI